MAYSMGNKGGDSSAHHSFNASRSKCGVATAIVLCNILCYAMATGVQQLLLQPFYCN